ncbi:MAG: PAS domain S-box protein [Halobacteriaceae archaeon]
MSDAVRVLLVDDHGALADTVAAHLEREFDRLTVETAGSADDGLDRLAAGEFDAVISDYDMPGDDGVDFLRAVRDRDPDLPFVLFTAEGGEAVASEAISAGVTDYVQKRSNTEQYRFLGRRVLDAVDHRRATVSYREIFEKVPYGIVVHHPEGGIVDLNRRYADLFGYDREELLDAGFGTVLPDEEPHTQTAAQQQVRAAMETGARTFEWPGVRKDGERFLAEVHLTPIRLHGEDLVLAVVREADSGARELERYRAIVEETTDVISIVDADGIVQYQSPAIERVLGYDQAELVGESAFEYMHPEDRDRVVAAFEAMLDQPGAAEQVEYRFRHADGSWRWLESKSNPRSDAGVEGVVISSRDVTERIERQRRLREQNAKIAALHRVATDIDACDTAAAVYERVVRAAEDILEFDTAIADEAVDGELVPRAVSSELDEDDYYESTPIDDPDNLGARAYRTGETSVVDDLRDHDLGADDPDFRSALSVPIGDHGLLQVVTDRPGAFDGQDRELAELLAAHAQQQLAILEDQRRLRERAAEVERKNDRLEEFTSVVSHDLRNPLNVAIGTVEQVRRSVEDERLDTAAEALDRMESLIDDLLTLARSGDRVQEPEAIDLAATAATCWETVATADASLIAETDRTVVADRSRLRQLLENLIRNSVEHGGDEVTVTVGDLDDGFYVADDGPGLSADEREALDTDGHAATGTAGLGLSIVARIATAHGWDIQVGESERGGARFAFTGVDRPQN